MQSVLNPHVDLETGAIGSSHKANCADQDASLYWVACPYREAREIEEADKKGLSYVAAEPSKVKDCSADWIPPGQSLE